MLSGCTSARANALLLYHRVEMHLPHDGFFIVRQFFALVIFTRPFSFCMEIASCKQYVNFQHIPLFCWIPDKKHGCNGCSNTILQRFLADQGAYRKGSFPLRRLDGVVSNAGIGMGRSPLHEYDEEDYERIFNLNSKGVLTV